MSKFIDLTGQKFGRLTVIKQAKNNKYNHTCWLCKCDCGKEVVAESNSLKNGRTKSCGCLRSEKLKLKRGINYYEILETEETILLHIVSKKYGEKIFKIDLEDYDKVSTYHWGVRQYRNNFYAFTHLGNYKYIGLHRLVINAPQDKMVDHIDHCTLNNKKENLKICTNTENQHNRKGLEGIRKTKWGFQVVMSVDNKRKCFGTYKTFEEAKQVRINAEKEYRPYVKEINRYGE